MNSWDLPVFAQMGCWGFELRASCFHRKLLATEPSPQELFLMGLHFLVLIRFFFNICILDLFLFMCMYVSLCVPAHMYASAQRRGHQVSLVFLVFLI